MNFLFDLLAYNQQKSSTSQHKTLVKLDDGELSTFIFKGEEYSGVPDNYLLHLKIVYIILISIMNDSTILIRSYVYK